MNRRTALKWTGSSAIGLLAGCVSSDGGSSGQTTTTKSHHTAIKSSNEKYPSYSGTISISGDQDFWSFGLDMAEKFLLSYTVENAKSNEFDFDVFVFTQSEYDKYVDKVQGDNTVPDAIDEASSEGILTTASKTIEMDSGTYFFVVDNTDIGDAGDFGSEKTRKVQVELQTKDPSKATPTKAATPTVTPTQDTRHSPNETFTVGSGEKTLQYTVRPDGVYEAVGITEADGVFFVVELDIKNVGEEPVRLSSDMYTLVNEKGQEYAASVSAMAQMENSLLFKELNPGVETTGHIPFDIPQGQEGVDDIEEHAYALQISPAGVFSLAETHIVDLATVDM